MAERAPGAGLGFVIIIIIIYNNMIMMMPVFILFCVVVLLVVVQRMNRMPRLSKSPSPKVKQNPLPPFQHRGSVPFVMCHVHVYLVRSVTIRSAYGLWLHFPTAEYVVNRAQSKHDMRASGCSYCESGSTGFDFSNLYWFCSVFCVVCVLTYVMP